MKKNKLDNSIKEKFSERTIEPSVSAWERLSVKLDEQPNQNKKSWFSYIGYAASVLVLISVGIYTFSEGEHAFTKKQIIVEENRDTTSIQNKVEQHFNAISNEKAIVKSEKGVKKQKNKFIGAKNIHKKTMALKDKRLVLARNGSLLKENLISKNKEKIRNVKIKENIPIIIPIRQEFKNKTSKKQHINRRITVDADDLLFAVTNSSMEFEQKDAKQIMSRKEMLKSIKIELKKSNLKVNPEIILSEVERTINNDIFQNNFLKSLKKRISNITSAIASRND
jgi:hypothetical protein